MLFKCFTIPPFHLHLKFISAILLVIVIFSLSLCDSSTVVKSGCEHCESVCFGMFVDEASRLDAHVVCSGGWHGTEGLSQCQEGGLTDGEHYIIAASRVIEDAVDHGVCIQAKCWVGLSATPQILKSIKFICSIYGMKWKRFLLVCEWTMISLFLCLPPFSVCRSFCPEDPWVTFWMANITSFICLFMSDLFPLICMVRMKHRPVTSLFQTHNISAHAIKSHVMFRLFYIILFYSRHCCYISVFLLFLLQINCVTFPLPGEGPEQQLLKPEEWSYCDYFWVSFDTNIYLAISKLKR